MKNRFTFLLISLIFFTHAVAQNWKPMGALAASGSDWYLTGATSVGKDIFAVNLLQTMVYSTDLGVTWSAPAATKLKGTYAYIQGIENRLYASTKLNTYDYELHYSTDRGATWKPDTVGLPQSLTKTGKAGMILKYMGNGHMLAHNYSKAFYKKVEETNWKPTSIDFIIVDIAATKDKWLAIGAAKILQSTNNGESWTVMNTTGLPANFQGSLICSNGKRIFILNDAATGAETIYFSDDGGSNWTKTNSGGKYDYANPWIQSMYAVENYIFASVRPKFANAQDAPPFIISSEQTPDFSVGDVTGIHLGITNTYLPFFFHIENKLFTMFWDIYRMDIDVQNNTTTSKSVELEDNTISVYPNPASHSIQIQSGNIQISNIEIFSLTGKKVFQQTAQHFDPIDISSWSNGIYMVKTTTSNGQIYQTKFIKNK